MNTENKQVMPLDQFIKENQVHMLVELGAIVRGLKEDMLASPSDYIDTYSDAETPSIDIRLCIDLTPSRYRSTGWLFRTGLVDYDQYHSEYCAASSVTPDTDAKELLQELIDQLD